MTAPALPPCAQPGVNAGIGKGAVVASICGLSIVLPTFTFGFTLPPFPALPIFTLPSFSFKLSCDLKNPIDITGNLPSVAVRVPCYFGSPDDQ